MKEKTPQEQMAANRQIDMLIEALEHAKDYGGIWLNHTGKPMPKIYEKGPSVSPFNALVLAMHSDRNGYGTNLYTTFMDSRKRGDSILSGEKGAPFFYYRWDTYVNRANAEDKISREDYQALPEADKAKYKAERHREIRTLFNLSQTTMPMADAEGYKKLLETFGGANERGYMEREDNQTRSTVNNMVKNISENLVQVRETPDDTPRYDSKDDAVYMPSQKSYADYPEYVHDLLRQIVAATGHQQRLSREGMVMRGGKAPSEDAVKYEALVAEVASGIKMMELGLQAKLRPESQQLVEYWSAQLRENPKLIDALESDVNNALEVVRKAEKGEKVEFASKRNARQTDELRNADRPQVTATEALIIQDILRHGGFKIDSANFPGDTPEEREQAKKEFMSKFCNLEYYEGQTSLALWQAKENQTDPELVNVAYTVATNEASRIHRVMSEFMPRDWEERGSHYIAEEMMSVPDKKSKEFMVISHPERGVVDVVLPECARSGGDVIMPNGDRRNYWITPDEVMLPEERKEAGAKVVSHNLPGMNKDKIAAALMAQGATYVRFFNKDGELRYHPDDAYFKGCDVYSARLNGKDLVVTARFDVSEAVSRATEVQFNRVQMMKADDGRWALLLKAENEPSFAVYPDKEDCNRFFATLKQGDNEAAIALRNELGQKYYAMVKANPSLAVNLFYDIPEDIDASKIQRATIFRTRDDKILMSVSVDGMDKIPPREISDAQWKRFWVADDVQAYKFALASHLFGDVLPKKDVSEQQAQDAAQTEAQDVSEEQKQEQQAQKQREEQQEDRQENAKEAVNAIIVSLSIHDQIKQYNDLKVKHPDAILLFRDGNDYFVCQDDVKSVKDVLHLKVMNMTDSDGTKFSMARFPHSELDTNLPKLVRAGFRIAICEQMEQQRSQRVDRGSVEASQTQPKQEEHVAQSVPHFRR